MIPDSNVIIYTALDWQAIKWNTTVCKPFSWNSNKVFCCKSNFAAIHTELETGQTGC